LGATPISSVGSLGVSPATATLTQKYSLASGQSLSLDAVGSHQGNGNTCRFLSSPIVFTAPDYSVTQWVYNLVQTVADDGSITSSGSVASETNLPFSAFPVTTLTPTQLVRTGNGCVASSASTSRLSSGAKTIALTNEDTEDAAIARLLAGSAGAWSAWATTGTLTPAAAARAKRADDSVSFAYSETQLRITAAGLTPNKAYSLKLRLGQTSADSTALGSSYYRADSVDLNAASDGTLSYVYTVPTAPSGSALNVMGIDYATP